MKKCQGCTSSIADESQFCPICGRKQEVMKPVQVTNRFCAQCGGPLAPNIEICGKCGSRNAVAQTREIFRKTVPEVINRLSVRITASAITWICVSAMQLLCAMLMIFCFIFVEQDFAYLWALVVYGVLAGLNIFGAVKDLEYKEKIKKNFVGIIYHYRITAGRVGACIYNLYVVWALLTSENWFTILIGFVTLAAVVVEFFCITYFIYSQKNALIQLENSQI